MKVLIIKLSSFGDILHCLPVLTNFKNNFPDWQIDWLISENFAALLENHKQINKLYKLPKKPLNWPKTLSELKEQKYDYILEMQGLIKTSLIAKFINAKKILGVTPFRERIGECFLTDKIESDKIHIIERSAAVLKYFGLEKPNLSDFGFAQNNKETEKIIICAPEARWESKVWPHWPEFIEKLKKEFAEYKIVLLGSQQGKEERLVNNAKELVKEIEIASKKVVSSPCQGGGGGFCDTENSNIIDLRGKTKLKDLPEIIVQAELLIGADSGLIHLASALGKKTLGFYGPTLPARTGPWNGNFIWLNLECSPCHKRKCPLEGENNLKCLKQISPNLALEKVKEILC